MYKSIIALVLGSILGVAAATAFFTLKSGATPSIFTGFTDDREATAEFSAEPTFTRSTEAGNGLIIDTEVNVSLAELASIENAKSRRDASLVFFDNLGGNQNSLVRVAAALPAEERINFTFDAIARLATENALAAIALASSLDGLAVQTKAIERIAELLATRDPHSAFANAAEIENYLLADAYKAALLEAWAGLDTESFLSFVGDAMPGDIPAGTEAFQIAAAGDPEEFLAAIDAVPQAARATLQRVALAALVQTDPNAAFMHIDRLPAGDEHDRLLSLTAQGFARQDIDSALAWLGSRQPPEAAATTGVMIVLAEVDPVRGAQALITTLRNSSSISAQFSLEVVMSSFARGARQELPVVAEQLSAVDDSLVQLAYDRFMDYWSRNDPAAAYDWAFANSQRLTPSSLFYLARNLANTRPELAKQAADRIPAEMQREWVHSVVGPLAQADFNDALQWLSRYQGQDYYEAAVEAAIDGVSLGRGATDLESVAALVDRQSSSMRTNTVPVVANVWAERDPQAAARWIDRMELDAADEHRRNAAFSNIAMRWAEQDADAARDWVLGRPQSEDRDQILGSMLSVTAAAGSVDTRVIDAFSSDEARQRELANIMTGLGSSNPNLGRALIDQYLDDPQYRRLAEEQLIQGASNRPAVRRVQD